MAVILRGKTKPKATSSAEGTLTSGQTTVVVTAAQNTHGVVIHQARWVGQTAHKVRLNIGSVALGAGSVDFEGQLGDTVAAAGKLISFTSLTGTGDAPSYTITYEFM